MWAVPESNGQLISTRRQEQELQIVSEDCATKKVMIWILGLLFYVKEAKFVAKDGSFVGFMQKLGQEKDVMNEIYKTHESIQWVEL